MVFAVEAVAGGDASRAGPQISGPLAVPSTDYPIPRHLHVLIAAGGGLSDLPRHFTAYSMLTPLPSSRRQLLTPLHLCYCTYSK